MNDTKLHHTALCRVYISRKIPNGIKKPYAGKFGKGFVVYKPNWRSTRYSIIEYYIEVQ